MINNIFPNDAITIHDGKPMTTSLKIAEVFEREHRDVLDSIRSLKISEDFRERNFPLSSYVTSQNKSQPMYHLTKDGTTLLVMGFIGQKANEFKIAYIEAFNRMEATLKSIQKDEPELFQKHYDKIMSRLESIETTVKEQAPYVKIGRIMAGNTEVNIQDAARWFEDVNLKALTKSLVIAGHLVTCGNYVRVSGKSRHLFSRRPMTVVETSYKTWQSNWQTFATRDGVLEIQRLYDDGKLIMKKS